MEQLILSLAPPPPPTLENFFEGANGHALHALRALLTGGPDRSVHLWGPPGSGRTHLLRAAAAAVAAAGGTAVWAPADVGSANMPAPSLLLCDDVDRLDDHAQLQAFEMIDAARRGGWGTLTAALHPAHDLPVRADLRTRLAQSLAVAVTPLSDEEKRAALATHAADRGMPLAPETIDYVIARVRRDMGTLMAVIDALDRHSLRAQRPLTVPLAREVLQQLDF